MSESFGASRELLYTMADGILDAAPHQDWNVLIGDDAGGRLPAHFVRRVLRESGYVLPSYFVAGSQVYRERHGAEPYRHYFEHIATRVGEPLRPLIITESVGSGQTVDFLKENLRPYSSQEPQVAALAVRPKMAHVIDFYGESSDRAIATVGTVYEHISSPSIKQRTLSAAWGVVPSNMRDLIKSRTRWRIHSPSVPNFTVGIEPNLDSEVPIVRLQAGRNARLAFQAFRAMDQLASDYCQTRQ